LLGAADELGAMRRSWLAAVLVLSGAACKTPQPRLPFQSGGSDWRAAVLTGPWIVNKAFAEDTSVIGLEVVLDYPESGGWSWEGAFRYASGGDDGERLESRTTGVVVPSEQEIDFYELDLGVRQYYRPEKRLQPYIGVGLSVLYWQSEEHFVQSSGVPKTDHERGEFYPGIYGRTGLVLHMLRNQLRENTEFPVALDVRGLLSLDYSYLELSLSFGFGR
jgi:hypothetical protein